MSVLSSVINSDVVLTCLIEDGNASLYPQVTITKPDSSTVVEDLTHVSQGRYEVTVTGGNFSATGMYFCVYVPYTDSGHTTTSTDYYFSMDQILVSTADLSSLSDLIARVLGLNHDNSLIDMTQYDECNQLTAARVRVYDSASNLNAAIIDEPIPSTPGLTYMYMAFTTYDAPGKMGSYRLVRIN